MRGRPAAALLIVSALGAVACGGDRVDDDAVAPARVPAAVVPPTIQANQLVLLENQEAETKKTFAGAGEKALIADGRLWEVRQGERLVGALQLSTLKPEVDLTRRKDRSAILRTIMPGSVRTFTVADVAVFGTESNDKVVYLWFGRDLFAVLSLKGSRLEPEAIMTELVEYQVRSADWPPLLVDDDQEPR